MTITNTALALGSWAIKLKPGTPQDVIDRLQFLGHVAISVGRPDPRISGDSLLRSARYVGVLRKITYADEGPALSGAGMNYWLGDDNQKGPIIKAQLLFTSANFPNVVNQILSQSASVRAGQIHDVAGAYTGYHQFKTCREALTFVCSTMTSDTTNPVEFRVNGDATVDAGTAGDLYVHDTPVATIGRRLDGADLHVRAVPGQASVDEDLEDYATEVILLGQGEGLGITSAEVSLPDPEIPYKDLFGNTVKITRMVSQSSTDAANSLVQAQIALNQYASPRDAVTLSTDEFDIEGVINVGDSVWVHDPAASLVDTSPTPNEIIFRGERINPVKLRVSELTWPIEQGMSVAYRGPDGSWIDLTDYAIFETGSTQVTVGGYDRSLTNPTGRQEALGSRAAPNTSIPAAPHFLPNPVQAVYQSSGSGISKAQIQLRWLRPLNTDGTDIIDGDHYEIRYRTSDGPAFRVAQNSGTDTPVYPGSNLYPGSSTYPGDTLVGGSAAVIPPGSPSTWAQAAGLSWNQMGSWAQPIAYVAGPWLVAYAAFDTTQLLIQELTPAVPYQFQIRAVDNAVPPNFSSWSDLIEVVMAGDTIPPPTPAPPEVASSLIAVQLTHLLGAASGGTFNLPADMHHFEVHGAYEPTFTCSPATLLGKMLANNGMIVSQTPVVSTIAVASTTNIYIKVVAVDESGNRSNPSAPVQSTAALIDDEHISNLTVSKVTAGEIKADWLMGAQITTAPAGGARAGMDALGLFAYNAANARCWEVQDATGDMVTYAPTGLPSMRIEASTGNIYLYGVDGHTPTMKLTASAGLLDMSGRLTAGSGIGTGPTIEVNPVVDNPSINFYPDVSLDSVRLAASPITRPDGSSGSVFQLLSLDEGGVPDGFAINAWASNAWMGMLDGFGAWNPVIIFQQVGGGLFLKGTSIQITSPNTILQIDDTGLFYSTPSGGSSLEVAAVGGFHLDGGGHESIIGTTSGNFADFTATGSFLESNGAVKSFVIDHPVDPKRYLVHGCIEAPEAQVEYRGTAIIEDGMAVVELPGYFEAATVPGSATVHLTVELTTRQGKPMVCTAAPSEIKGGRFHIVAHAPDDTRCHWLVKATRADVPPFEVEPLRTDVDVRGDGPYRYIAPREKGAT